MSKKIYLILMLILFMVIYLLIFNFTINDHPYEKSKFIISDNSNEPNCKILFNRNASNKEKINGKTWNNPHRKTDENLMYDIQENCLGYLLDRNYYLNYTLNDENNFPIAFSILIYKDATQMERMFRLIYRPWNFYCIHVDLKKKKLFKIISTLVNCLNKYFHNIINIRERLMVEWGRYSVLKAELICMKELLIKFKKWKYFINLTGQEFPLKTNAEIVEILKSFKGANNVMGNFKEMNAGRKPDKEVNFPITWYKGSVHIAVRREFVKFIFTDPRIPYMLKAIKSRVIPDETFFATLYLNPQFRIPGNLIGLYDDHIKSSLGTMAFLIVRYKKFKPYKCLSGRSDKSICIFGVDDLPYLINSPYLFLNKFHENFESAAARCLELNYEEKMKNESKTKTIHPSINLQWYSNLFFVKHQYKSTWS